ncbi:hypothetical protein ACFWSF_09195 [Streptomyces sp. NPDC058611]|uniref:hypothetical protein n=1 Tax=unclassified Streptomyces TaxID=2593676 RepID=UPI00365371BD
MTPSTTSNPYGNEPTASTPLASGVSDADWNPLLTACATSDRAQALHHLDHHWQRIDCRLAHPGT